MRFRWLPSFPLVVFAWLLAPFPAAAGEEILAITGARVFDGVRFLPAATVVVSGGRITAVGPKVAVPPGARVVDGKGRRCCPA